MKTNLSLMIAEAQIRERERHRQEEAEAREREEEQRRSAIHRFKLTVLSDLGVDFLELGAPVFNQDYGPGISFTFNDRHFGLFLERNLRFSYWLVVHIDETYGDRVLRIEVFSPSAKASLCDRILCAISELGEDSNDAP